MKLQQLSSTQPNIAGPRAGNVMIGSFPLEGASGGGRGLSVHV